MKIDDTVVRLKKFLNCKTKFFEFDQISPDKLIKYAEKAGILLDHDNIFINGWQMDYGIPGKFKKDCFLLSGSAWYGDGRIEKVTQEDYDSYIADQE